MASAYPYLMASLPMLSFGSKPPFEFNDFLENCRDLIPDEDFKLLSLCADKDLLKNAVSQSTLRQWIAFETGLRNELVKIRASRRKIDPEKYLKPDGSGDTALYHIAMNSHRMPSILESEKSLDAARWRRLEELSFGHYFDPDALLVYGLKLLILWRWENVSRIDKPQMLDKVLSGSLI